VLLDELDESVRVGIALVLEVKAVVLLLDTKGLFVRVMSQN
jgi:hypothetical protein